MNSTFISLILKKSNSSSFDDFRPIALCNMVYKIGAKLLANRLKTRLSSSILSEQFGFLNNRKIMDVIDATQEGLHLVKVKKPKSWS